MKSPVKGFVLAAGLGTRLRPITTNTPKPLLPFIAPSLLDLALWKLRSAGVAPLFVNTHHLAGKIKEHLNDHPLFRDVKIFHENELLGTGGALNNIQPELEDCHLVIYNGDIISDIDIKALIDYHLAQDAVATLVLLPALLAGKNPLHVYRGEIQGIGPDFIDQPKAESSKHTFSGVHILSPRFFRRAPRSGNWHIIDLYQDLIKRREKICAFFHNGFWHDTGSSGEFWAAIRSFIDGFSESLDRALGVSQLSETLGLPFRFEKEGCGQKSLRPPVILPLNLTIPRSSKIGPYVVGSGALTIPPRVSIENSLLLPGSILHAGETVANAIVFADRRVSF